MGPSMVRTPAKVLDRLRQFTDHDFGQYPPGRHPQIEDLVPNDEDVSEAYSSIHLLVSKGIIIPGAAWALVGRRNNETFRAFPYFSLTPHGRNVLQSRAIR